MKQKLIILFNLLLSINAIAGFGTKLSIVQILKETDLVIVGKISQIKTWTVDNIEYAEATITVEETLLGEPPKLKLITIRGAHHIYQSDSLTFKNTEEQKSVWLLWKAQDGTYRSRHSNSQVNIKEKNNVIRQIKIQNKSQ